MSGSSPSTLTTSLAISIPSSSSSNGPTTTTLTTKGLCPGGSVVWAGRKFVRPHKWGSRVTVIIRFLEIQGPNFREILQCPLPKQSNTCLFTKKTTEEESAPAPEKPRLSHFHYSKSTELGPAGQFSVSHIWMCNHLWHLWPKCDQICYAKNMKESRETHQVSNSKLWHSRVVTVTNCHTMNMTGTVQCQCTPHRRDLLGEEGINLNMKM